MKRKILAVIIYLTIAFLGTLVVQKLSPHDDTSETATYAETVPLYIPPNATRLETFDTEKFDVVATARLAEYKTVASSGVGENFVTYTRMGGG